MATIDTEAIKALFSVYASCLLLHLILPARVVEGYCCDNEGCVLIYRLNGFSILLVSCIIFYFFPSTLLCEHYENITIAAILFGLVVSAYFYFRGGSEQYSRCITKDQMKDGTRPPLAKDQPRNSAWIIFFLGREWNPRYFGIDIKMILYAVSTLI